MSDTLSKVSLVGSISIHTLSFKEKCCWYPRLGTFVDSTLASSVTVHLPC